MNDHEIAMSATTEGLTISPSLDLVLEQAQVPAESFSVNWRTVYISGLAIILGVASAFIAEFMLKLIALITNVSFYGHFTIANNPPAGAVPHLGWFVVVIPVVGALIIGFMARYGSQAIRGDGIPEAMEQVLVNESRIQARITFLKPISSAIAIGTGGPFGAEGPIIATGGALGSALGQFLPSTVAERKVLLAAGAAAGIAATFGCPVAAVLLAIEVLLFEFRPRSIIPVALASCAATGVRMLIEGTEPIFGMPNLQQPSMSALAVYILLGAVIGLAAVGVTRLVYVFEDAFERLPIHWMWWPAMGAVAVGVVGYFVPDTLGVGYYNIKAILSNHLTLYAAFVLCAMKLISWSIALASGTSGGTLAPLFMIGGGMGAVMGTLIATAAPWLGVDPRIAALVGMASIFAGASRAMLASAVFAFETTLQPFGILPLLGGCAASYLASSLTMPTSIMTEKIARRGVRTPADYEADLLEQVQVGDIMSTKVVTLKESEDLADVRAWLSSDNPDAMHQGFPVVNDRGIVVGVVTHRDLLSPANRNQKQIKDVISTLLRVCYQDTTARQAVDHMVNHDIGRLPVVRRERPTQLAGIVTRSDILSIFKNRSRNSKLQEPSLHLFRRKKSKAG
ncbi:MAG TPA: chloride channel protein [Lacipirellulaceae bacterium]|nr:chloride channel protein [Lacipirellulaceae bacterium]